MSLSRRLEPSCGTELDWLHSGIATGSCIVAGLGRCVRSEDDISVVCFCKAQLNCVKCQVGTLPTPFCTLHFRLRTPHSTLPHCTPHTHNTLHFMHFTRQTPYSTVHPPRSTRHSLHSTLYHLRLHTVLHAAHSTFHTAHSTLFHTLNSWLYSALVFHFVLRTVHLGSWLLSGRFNDTFDFVLLAGQRLNLPKLVVWRWFMTGSCTGLLQHIAPGGWTFAPRVSAEDPDVFEERDGAVRRGRGWVWGRSFDHAHDISEWYIIAPYCTNDNRNHQQQHQHQEWVC